jgi:cell fate regulator YaaT (PSP1 superfamily)
MQQQNSSSPYTDSTAELDQGTEDNTPSKSKTSKNKVSKSTKKREIPMHFAVTVQCRHKQSEYMSKFPVSKGEYVFVEGDRGEDVGQVVACENVDPTNSPKTSGNVLRSAKTSEIDAFHSLSDEEHNCVRNCQGMVETLRLPLIVVRAAYQYDRKKLTFFYEATDRVDFRALLHDLYQEYRCRIWMERVE